MKKIKALLGSLVIAAILGANGYMAMSGTKAQSELTLEGVERVAEGEAYGVKSDKPYWDQSTKDVKCEYELIVRNNLTGSYTSELKTKGSRTFTVAWCYPNGTQTTCTNGDDDCGVLLSTWYRSNFF